MSEMPADECPACQEPADTISVPDPPRDIGRWSCGRCGVYDFTGQAKDTLVGYDGAERVQARKRIVEWLAKQSSDSIPVVTSDVVSGWTT